MDRVKVDLKTFYRAKQSINGRLARLRKRPIRWNYFDERTSENSFPSPIAKIGCFESEISTIENALKTMQDRIEHAEITILL